MQNIIFCYYVLVRDVHEENAFFAASRMDSVV